MPIIKNIALMAHVDAGKTTLTERLLFEAGVIRTLGSVDAGTSRSDDLAVERQRGISVRASLAALELGGVTVNLIDTPGHTDFYSQTLRSFLAVDAVLVLVSAVEGVQSGTLAIVREAAEQGLPVIFFINKCDRETADRQAAIAQIKALAPGAFDAATERFETAALFDDALMQAFLDDAPEDAGRVQAVLAHKLREGAVSPIVSGSALTGAGIAALLEVICGLAPSAAAGAPEDEPSGVVFSVLHDKTFGRGAYIRLFSGRLSVRETLELNGTACKLTLIRQQLGGRWADVRQLEAGGVGLVFGLSGCKTGDTFGPKVPERARAGLGLKALLTARISPANPAENPKLRAALDLLAAEDPALEPVYEPISGAMHLNMMGAIQTEVLTALIAERFGLDVEIGRPAVIYKETLAQAAIGYDAYTMPKPCWAVLKFALKPAARGAGVSFVCSAPPNRLPYRYRGQVEMSIAPSLRQGPHGWEVVDIDIDLLDGEDHPVHTHPLDFTIATALALADGLHKGTTVLLEPIMDMTLTFETAHLGRVTGALVGMRGAVQTADHHGQTVTLNARVPFAASLDFPAVFASMTSGRGLMRQKLHGYQECPPELGQTCPRRGVDPRDRAKYILAARNALSGTVFE